MPKLNNEDISEFSGFRARDQIPAKVLIRWGGDDPSKYAIWDRHTGMKYRGDELVPLADESNLFALFQGACTQQ